MKSIMKNKIVQIVLAVLMTLCLAIGIGIMNFDTKKVEAATTLPAGMITDFAEENVTLTDAPTGSAIYNASSPWVFYQNNGYWGSKEEYKGYPDAFEYVTDHATARGGNALKMNLVNGYTTAGSFTIGFDEVDLTGKEYIQMRILLHTGDSSLRFRVWDINGNNELIEVGGATIGEDLWYNVKIPVSKIYSVTGSYKLSALGMLIHWNSTTIHAGTLDEPCYVLFDEIVDNTLVTEPEPLPEGVVTDFSEEHVRLTDATGAIYGASSPWVYYQNNGFWGSKYEGYPDAFEYVTDHATARGGNALKMNIVGTYTGAASFNIGFDAVDLVGLEYINMRILLHTGNCGGTFEVWRADGNDDYISVNISDIGQDGWYDVKIPVSTIIAKSGNSISAVGMLIRDWNSAPMNGGTDCYILFDEISIERTPLPEGMITDGTSTYTTLGDAGVGEDLSTLDFNALGWDTNWPGPASFVSGVSGAEDGNAIKLPLHNGYKIGMYANFGIKLDFKTSVAVADIYGLSLRTFAHVDTDGATVIRFHNADCSTVDCATCFSTTTGDMGQDSWKDVVIPASYLESLADSEGKISSLRVSISVSQNTYIGNVASTSNSWGLDTSVANPAYIYVDSISAVTEPMAKYTVTFDYDGKQENAFTTLVAPPYKVTKPANPSVVGYDFIGWYANAERTVAFDFTQEISGNTTVYAKFNAVALADGLLTDFRNNDVGLVAPAPGLGAIDMLDKNDEPASWGAAWPQLITFDNSDGNLLKLHFIDDHYAFGGVYGVKLNFFKTLVASEINYLTFKVYVHVDTDGASTLRIYDADGFDYVEFTSNAIGQDAWKEITLSGEDLEKLADSDGNISSLQLIFDPSANAYVGNIAPATNGWGIDTSTAKPCYIYLDNITYQEYVIEQVSVSVGEALTLNVYANADISMEFEGEDGEVVSVSGVATTSGYLYQFENIAPNQMTEVIQIRILNGETVVDSMEFVIADYLKALIDMQAGELGLTTASKAALDRLAADMLEYGAAAQAYTGYKTNNLANVGLQAGLSSSTAVNPTSKFKLTDNKVVEGVKFNSAGVRFANVNYLYFKFTTTDVSKTTVEINGTVYTQSAFHALGGNGYAVYSEGIKATEFDKTYTAVLKLDGTAVQTVDYSVNSYIASKATGGESAMKTLATKLYYFGQSSVAYVAAIAAESNYVISTKATPAQVNSKSYAQIGGKDVMPIGVYSGFSAAFLTDAYFQELTNDLGINLILTMMDNKMDVDVEKALTLAEKYGVGAYLFLEEVSHASTADNLTAENIKAAIAEFYDHRAVVGLLMKDEPAKEDVADNGLYGNFADIFESTGLSEYYDTYWNAFPMHGDAYTGDAYEQYLRDMIENLGLQYLSYDYYPFIQSGYNGKTSYYQHLSVVRKISNEYDIPFWSFIGAGVSDEKGKGGSYPTEAQLHWNINTTLAYGAKGIEYFELRNTTFANPTSANLGLYGTNMEHNKWYDYVKNINPQIKAVDEVLMNSTNLGVIFSGNTDTTGKSDGSEVLTSFRQLTSVSGNLLVGCFDYNGATALYVVNNDFSNATTAKLNFDNNYKYNVIQDAYNSCMVGDTVTLNLAAGEGVLVVLN